MMRAVLRNYHNVQRRHALSLSVCLHLHPHGGLHIDVNSTDPDPHALLTVAMTVTLRQSLGPVRSPCTYYVGLSKDQMQRWEGLMVAEQLGGHRGPQKDYRAGDRHRVLIG